MPPGYRLVYNVNGDQNFHLLPLVRRGAARMYMSGGRPFQLSPCTSCSQLTINGTSNPVLLVEDASPSGTTTNYLTVIQAVNGPDASIPLQVANQVTSTGNANNLTSIASGYGGLDIVQNTPASTGPTTNYSSPYFRMCAQEVIGPTPPGPSPGPDCWLGQVVAGSGANATDVFQWTRQTANTTTNITMLWPKAINLSSVGQITVGPEPITGVNANVPSTFTGQKTSSLSGSAAAGPVTLEPGQLTAGTAAAGMAEGALQILQSYIVGSSTPEGQLACPSGTAQTISVCTTTGAAENWIGVFNSIVGAQGITVTPLRYGRVGVSSSASGLVFNDGDFVCKDDTTAGFVVDNSSTPCPVSQLALA